MRTFFVALSLAGLLGLAGVASAAFTEDTFPAPTVTIYGEPSSVTPGGTVTLTWSSIHSRACTASGAWSGAKARSGRVRVNPSASSTYILTCMGRGGETSSAVTVAVETAPEPPPPPRPEPPVATTTQPTPTTTPPTQPPVTPTSTPPTTPTTTPPTQPPTSSCAGFTVPSCSIGWYPTPGAVDSKGCIGASICTQATQASVPVAFQVPSGRSYAANGEYGGTGVAGASAAILYAPTTGSANMAYTNLGFNARKNMWISGKIGLLPVVVTSTTTAPRPPVRPPAGGAVQGATYGGSLKVTISISAAKIDASDAASEVLYSTVLTPQSGLVNLRIPVGVWGLRGTPTITVAVEKSAADTQTYGVVVDGLGAYTFGDRPDQGIVNNDPEWKSADQQGKQIAALASFPVAWVHDSIRTTGASWGQAPLLKRVQDQGKKIQLVVGPVDEDYTEGIGARVPGTNEWGGALPFSKLNLDLYEQRLKNNLTSYKNAGVDVKAVEVGNELDLLAFNADIPTDRVPSDADYQKFAAAYAKFLERTVAVVKRPEFYPNAKIILGSPAIDWSPSVGKFDPAKMYAPLKNLNGKNYFALVDGVGLHFYPADSEDGQASVMRGKAFLAALGLTDRPVWISEWGFYNNRFPHTAGQDRYRGFVSLYDKILRADYKVVFMTNFALDEFAFPFHLVDQNYQKLPEARFFDHYPSPVPSTIALEPVTVPPVACIWCPLSDWSEEVWADLRDVVLRLTGN